MKAQTVNYFNPSLSQVQWESGITGRQTPVSGRGDMKVVYLASFGLWHELSECPKTNKETQLGFSVATATGQVTGFFSLLCKPQSMYNSNSLPCATMMLLRSALSTPAFSPALPFSSKNSRQIIPAWAFYSTWLYR